VEQNSPKPQYVIIQIHNSANDPQHILDTMLSYIDDHAMLMLGGNCNFGSRGIRDPAIPSTIELKTVHQTNAIFAIHLIHHQGVH